MNKKFIYFFILILSILSLIFSLAFNNNIYEFSADNVKKNIDYLSSSTFNGRLAGSNENALVGEIIKNKFKELSLSPLTSSYTEDYFTTCPVKTDESSFFKISSDSGNEFLKYGVDYKEDMINFKNNSFNFSNKDKITVFSTSIEVVCDDGKLLMYLCKDDNLSFRSSFLCNLPYDLVIAISSNAYNKILDSLKNNAEISTYIPFKNEDIKISNIIGVIEGSDSSLSPLILTAHFDHLGSDIAGTVYSGSLDNASGTSFLLELANTFSSYGKPKRTIIFVALNAEELGLKGSEFFAQNNYFNIKNSMVINFDMIGASNTPVSFIQGTSYTNKESSLLTSLTSICDKKNINYIVNYEDSSDHASFNNLGIDALTLCHNDTSNIHTPHDTVDKINTDTIHTVYSIIDEKIKKDCYSNVTIFLCSKRFVNLNIIILVTILIIGLLNTKPFKNEKCKIKN